MAATAPFTLNRYQQEAVKTDRVPGNGLTFPLLGLFGEAGTLLSVVKKKQRDAAAYLGYEPHVTEESGTCFGISRSGGSRWASYLT